MQLTSQMEDYLEAIYEVCQERGVARVKDLAERLGVSNPSVVGAMRSLKQKRLIEQERYGYIRLTARGRSIAETVAQRHHLLTAFLEEILGLDAKTASTDACKIEHAVSARTMRRLVAAAAFLKSKVHDDLDWPIEFSAFCRGQGEEDAG